MTTWPTPIEVMVEPDTKPIAAIEGSLDDRFHIRRGDGSAGTDLGDARVVFTTSRLQLSAEALTASKLRVVAKVGTGLNNIDLDAAAAEGITVLYTPGMNAISVAEHAVALLLSLNRQVLRGAATLTAGGWRDELPISYPLVGSTVGIVGFGSVGQRVARLLAGFNTRVMAYDPYVDPTAAELVDATLTTLDELLEVADAVIVTAKLTPETRGMIDAGALDRMRDDAVIVNTARGAIIDEPALIAALEQGQIRGAALDVFETEPLPQESPLLGMEGVIATPHIAAASIATRTAILETLAQMVTAVVDGGPVDARYVAVEGGA
jgi:Lactate dehydrogenase and related dehydrogenases